jgi:ABC-2 type transport system ATP-binding protein
MPAILEVDNLKKRYGDTEVVKGISFSVEEGEVFGLLGPNGAGKTQTISMLTGVIPPTSGTARIGGYDLLAEREQVKKINGLVPQDLALYPTLSAKANLNFFGRIYGLHGKELKERVDDVLHIVALTERANQAVEKYSGGMKRRVNIGAGLLHYPRLLFLDEPTVGVDPQSRNQIFESVQQLNRERGMSVVYTSHYMEEVELLCNRVAIIDQGQIIALDTIKNLIAILGGGVLMVGVSQVDEAMLKEISALPGVKSANLVAVLPEAAAPEAAPAAGTKEVTTGALSGPQLKIECENSQEALISLISYMADKDLRITALDILEPNLESVFLHLTGKKLRE